MNSILRVRQNSADFFVLAEKNTSHTKKKLVDVISDLVIPTSEFTYALTQIKDGKPKSFIGYISCINEKTQCMLRMPSDIDTDSGSVKFISTPLYIVDRIYDF